MATLVSTGQITIVDNNDVTISISAPVSPVLNQLWFDTSPLTANPVGPAVMKIWTGSSWAAGNITAEEYQSFLSTTTGTINYRTSGPPTNTPTPTGVAYSKNADGSIDIKVSWDTYIQGPNKADNILVVWKSGVAPLGKPTLLDNVIETNVNIDAPSYLIIPGVPSSANYTIGVAASRRTENATEVTSIASVNTATMTLTRASSAQMSDFTVIGSGSPRYESFAPEIGTFTRASNALKYDKSSVSSNIPRYEDGKFGKSITIEGTTTNLCTTTNFLPLAADASWHAVTPNTLANATTYTISFWYSSKVSGTLSVSTTNVSELQYQSIVCSPQKQKYIKTFTTTQLNEQISFYAIAGNDIVIEDIQVEAGIVEKTFTTNSRAIESLTLPISAIGSGFLGTIECWVKFNSDSPTYQPVIDICGVSSLEIYRSTTNIYATVGAGTLITGPSVAKGQWVHIALTWGNSQAQLFVNGTPVTAVAITPILNLATSIGVGQRFTGQRLNGNICDLRFYPTKISSQRILSNAQATTFPLYERDVKVFTFDSTLAAHNQYGSALVMEEGTTNLCTYPSTFTDAFWTKQSTATLNVITGPNGAMTGSSLKETATTDFQFIYHPFTVPAAIAPKTTTSCTFSIYVKGGLGRDWVFIRVDQGEGNGAWFNITNGTIGTIKPGMTATITPAAYGWFRCSISGELLPGAGYGCLQITDSGSNSGAYAGNTSKGVYIWSAQTELKLFPTSLISGTRADERGLLPASGTIGRTGTIESWVKFRNVGDPASVEFLVNNQTWGVRSFSFGRMYSKAGFFVADAVGFSTCFGPTTLERDRWYHLAGTWENNTIKLYQDGILVDTNYVNLADFTIPTNLDIGNLSIGNSIPNAYIDSLKFSSKAKTATELLAEFNRNRPMTIDGDTTVSLDFNGQLTQIDMQDITAGDPLFAGSVLPAFTLPIPSTGEGLFMSADKMGYYKNNAWNTYIGNDGRFKFAGSDAANSIDWNITTPNVLTIRGKLTADDIKAGTMAANYIGTGTLTASQSITVGTGGVVIESLTANNSAIRAGKATYADALAGFWLGVDGGTPKFKFYKDASNYIDFTGSSFAIRSPVNVNDISAVSLTAVQANIPDLSSLRANLGAITAGTVTLGTNGSHIKGGQTAYNTGTGFWLGTDATGTRFSVGNSAGNSLKWDGSALTIGGMTPAQMDNSAIVIGGRNLLLNSGVVYTKTTSYLINVYTASKDFVAGKTYTVSIKGSVNSPNQLGAWQNSGSSLVGYFVYNSSRDLYELTFNAVATTGGNERKLSIYNSPSGTATSSLITTIKMEEGNKSTDWTEAPEDIATQTIIDGGLITTGRIEVGPGTVGSGNAGINGSGSATTDIRFWAGSTYANAAVTPAPFRVQNNGKVYASDIEIAGSIVSGKTLTVGGTISAIGGDITVGQGTGQMVIHGNNTANSGGYINSGKTAWSDTNNGFWLGARDATSTAAPVFHIGNSSCSLKYDGTDLELKGDLRVIGTDVGKPSSAKAQGVLRGNTTGDLYIQTTAGTAAGWSKVWHENLEADITARISSVIACANWYTLQDSVGTIETFYRIATDSYYGMLWLTGFNGVSLNARLFYSYGGITSAIAYVDNPAAWGIQPIYDVDVLNDPGLASSVTTIVGGGGTTLRMATSLNGGSTWQTIAPAVSSYGKAVASGGSTLLANKRVMVICGNGSVLISDRYNPSSSAHMIIYPTVAALGGTNDLVCGGTTNQTWIAGIQNVNGSIYRSTDYGATWGGPYSDTGAHTTSVKWCSYNNTWFALRYSSYDVEIRKSTDDGITWTQAWYNNFYSMGSFPSVGDICISENIIIAAYSFGGTSYGSKRFVLISYDYGTTWIQKEANYNSQTMKLHPQLNGKGFLMSGARYGTTFNRTQIAY